jgi:hypothetical protein
VPRGRPRGAGAAGAREHPTAGDGGSYHVIRADMAVSALPDTPARILALLGLQAVLDEL